MDVTTMSTVQRILVGSIIGAAAVGIGVYVHQNWGKSTTTTIVMSALPAVSAVVLSVLMNPTV